MPPLTKTLIAATLLAAAVGSLIGSLIGYYCMMK